MNTIEKMMWYGDSLYVEKRRLQYNCGDLSIISWANIIYSSRHKTKYHNELIKLHNELMDEAYILMYAPIELINPIDSASRANQADILSTIILYLSSNQSNKEHSKNTLETAFELVNYGFDILNTFNDLPTHTRMLLVLTLVEIYIANEEIRLAKDSLTSLLNQKLIICDPNQKARILRKTGISLRKLGSYSESFMPSIEACLVPHSTPEVRIKSFVALFNQ